MSVREAFYNACKDAKVAKGNYVSLYRREPFYGGPEEGGWYGSDVVLEASQFCSTEEEAEAKLAEVEKMVEEKNKEAKKEWGDQCLREMEQADAKGMDYDELPETDGEVSYFVVVEEIKGASESEGCRHYE